jgi:hypothetical protein
VIGFKTTLWLAVVALAGHGVFDFLHHLIIDDPAFRSGGRVSACRTTWSPPAIWPA